MKVLGMLHDAYLAKGGINDDVSIQGYPTIQLYFRRRINVAKRQKIKFNEIGVYERLLLILSKLIVAI